MCPGQGHTHYMDGSCSRMNDFYSVAKGMSPGRCQSQTVTTSHASEPAEQLGRHTPHH
jgi:hypothetical protein